MFLTFMWARDPPLIQSSGSLCSSYEYALDVWEPYQLRPSFSWFEIGWVLFVLLNPWKKYLPGK